MLLQNWLKTHASVSTYIRPTDISPARNASPGIQEMSLRLLYDPWPLLACSCGICRIIDRYEMLAHSQRRTHIQYDHHHIPTSAVSGDSFKLTATLHWSAEDKLYRRNVAVLQSCKGRFFYITRTIRFSQTHRRRRVYITKPNKWIRPLNPLTPTVAIWVQLVQSILLQTELSRHL